MPILTKNCPTMPYKIIYKTKFLKDLKRLKKQGKNLAKLEKIIEIIANDKPLPPKNRDHALIGNWKDHRDCHIEPDWVLIYKKEQDVLILELTRTGSHADLLDL